MLQPLRNWFNEIRRPVEIRKSKMLTPFDGQLLEWMMGHGLAYIGTMPPKWRPRPEGWKAWRFYLLHMWWRQFV